MAKAVDIYGLYCPDTGAIRYIGKANCAHKRLKTHIRDSRRRQTPLYVWVSGLLATGKLPILQILSSVSPNDWALAEIKAISEARAAGADLLNVAKGGNEPHCPAATRAKNGRRATLARASNPTKARFYKLKHDLGVALRQGHVSVETRTKLRGAALRHPDKLPAQWAFL